MDAPVAGESVHGRPLEDRLDSWKEIAAYLKRDVTTVQRWEKREGMPVHRHLHDRVGSVYASRAELDAWAKTRTPASAENGHDAPAGNGTLASDPQTPLRTPRRTRWMWVISLSAIACIALGTLVWLDRTEYFWRSPIAGAQFQTITDFDSAAEAAAISRDGHLVAFLSDRDGPMDVWVTQVGSGEYHNLTHGTVQGLANPSVRTVAFSPDSSLVSFWFRTPGSVNGKNIGTWAAPTLGGQPRPYLNGVAEFDWSRDDGQLAFHTSGPGDPLFLSTDGRPSDARLLFKAAAGLHSHFPLWSPDGAYIYFVHGSVPDKLDIWRVASHGGTPERITFINGPVMYPVFLDRRTLLYLATDAEGNGPWLYSLDVERRIPHRLTLGPDRYTSLAASADGRHLAATIATAKHTLWRLDLAGSIPTEPTRIALTTVTGSAPRLGPDYLLYSAATGSGEGIWKLAAPGSTQLWHASDSRLIGAPAISADGRSIAFAVRQDGRSLLYAMLADGTNAHVLTDSLDLDGAPAWSPDGRFIAIAAKDHGTPHLLQVPVNGGPPLALITAYSVDPTWSPDNRLVLYSGPDVGTTFAVKTLPISASAASAPPLTLTRGARHLRVTPDGRSVLFLDGDIQHKNLWQMDLRTGARRALTNFPPGFDVRDFDISPDAHEIVLERVQDRSEVVLLDLPQGR